VETPSVEVPLPPRRNTLVLVFGFALAMAVGVGATALVMRRPPQPTPEPTPEPAPPPVVQPAQPTPKDELVVIAPDAPTKVLFHIESVPAGATVTLEGQVLGVTPLDLERPAGKDGRTMLEVTLSKDGFLPVTATAGGSGGRVDLLQKLQPLSEEMAPNAPAPKDVVPKDVVPKDVAPKDVAPKDVAPKEAAPKRMAPPTVKEPPSPKPKATATHKATKPVEKKVTKPIGPRPASKLDEDDEPAPVNELKRPSP
jgi:outer membrane biosynthesis protein TonB